MASPLIETKLYVPTRRRGLVARPRLGERLSRGAEATLTLVSAPAGFGKSTLLGEWLTEWQGAAHDREGPGTAGAGMDGATRRLRQYAASHDYH